MTINKRIEKIKIYYFGSERGNHKKFIKKLNVASNTASNWMKDGYNVGKSVVNSILEAFPEISAGWLLTGEGEMLKTNKKNYEESESHNLASEPTGEYIQANYKLVPLYSLDVVGGITNQEADTMGYITGYMPFVNAKKEDIATTVTGNSMYPTYPAGCYILIRKLQYWQEYIEYGQVHIIELLDDRRLIKEVRRGCDERHLKLISHNEDFDETQVSTDFVRAVWLVLAKYEKSTM